MREAYATFMDVLRAELGSTAPVSSATVVQRVQSANENVHGRINLVQALLLVLLVLLLTVGWGVWRIEGHSAASKEYRGKRQFVDEVLAPFAARFATGTSFRPVQIRAVLADGDTTIVVWDGRGVPNDGRAYENSYAWVMRMRDGQVVDGTAFYDSLSFNDLWSRVRPEA